MPHQVQEFDSPGCLLWARWAVPYFAALASFRNSLLPKAVLRESAPQQTGRTTAKEGYCYHPDENRNVARRRAARSVSTGSKCRNAAVKAQANASKNCRTMPALGESVLVYG